MDGIISIIKPPGVTSHDVIGMLRGILKTKRIGHSGTLDPMAAGVLPIYVGKATRLIEYGDKNNKTYIAECQFGYATDTEDITGNKLLNEKTMNYKEPTWDEIEAACKSFVGNISQLPSKYSAIKINGKRAYELARAGIKFSLPPRDVSIYTIKLIVYKYPYFTIEVSCSSGTYIRSLLRDICLSLGKVGTMSALHRIKVDQYTIAESYTIDELHRIEDIVLMNVDEAVAYLPIINLSPNETKDLCQGKRLSKYNKTEKNGLYRLYEDKQFLGIVEVNEKCIQSKKILYFPKAMQ